MSNHNINSETKEEIRKKRGDKCERCGKLNGPRGNPNKRLQLHHKKPRYEGGSNKQSNLILLCKDCHDKAHMKHYKAKLIKIQKTFKELIKSGKYRTSHI